MSQSLKIYEYKVFNIEVVDGDTIKADVDLGFGIWRRETFRLSGINAPEARGDTRDDGLKSKEQLEKYINTSSLHTIETMKDRKGKYGRYIATLYGIVGPQRIDINKQMVRDGFAVAKEY